MPSTPQQPPSPIRILILETDSPHPEIHSTRGSYADILSSHFRRAADAHDPPLDVKCDMRFVVKDKGGNVPSLRDFEGFHGVLLTGSLYDAHEEGGWVVELMERLKEAWQTYPHLHFTGVCFGHQLLCRMLGSEIGDPPGKGWELGHSRIDLTPIGRRLFRTSEEHIHLHQMHQDAVLSPPDAQHPLLLSDLSSSASSSSSSSSSPPSSFSSSPSARSPHTSQSRKARVHIWGSSPHTPIQGIYIPQRLFTTQAHLAFDEQMVKKEIEMREQQGSVDRHGADKEEVKEAEEWADAEHDGENVARALLRFFAYEDDGISQEED